MFDSRYILENCVENCCWESASSDTDGNQIPGEPWPRSNVKSVWECANYCETNPRCSGFHYYGHSDSLGAEECYLKSGVTKISKYLTDGRDRYGGICRKGMNCFGYCLICVL